MQRDKLQEIRAYLDKAAKVGILTHRGSEPRAALPITSGERSNLVVWLFGKDGHSSNMFTYDEPMSREERWKKPTLQLAMSLSTGGLHSTIPKEETWLYQDNVINT